MKQQRDYLSDLLDSLHRDLSGRVMGTTGGNSFMTSDLSALDYRAGLPRFLTSTAGEACFPAKNDPEETPPDASPNLALVA